MFGLKDVWLYLEVMKLENQKQLEAEQKIKEAEEIVENEVKQETKQTNRGHKKSKRK